MSFKETNSSLPHLYNEALDDYGSAKGVPFCCDPMELEWRQEKVEERKSQMIDRQLPGYCRDRTRDDSDQPSCFQQKLKRCLVTCSAPIERCQTTFLAKEVQPFVLPKPICTGGKMSQPTQMEIK